MVTNTLAVPNPVQQSPTEQTAGVLSLSEPGDEAIIPAPRAAASLSASGDHDLAGLRAALSALQSEFSTYGDVVRRMATACAEEQQARNALNSRMQRLVARLDQATNKS